MPDPAQSIGAIVLTVLGVVFHFLQEDNPLAMFSSFSQWFREINEWLAAWSGISTQGIVKAEVYTLFFFGLGMMQIGEYAVAVGCWIVLAFIVLSKALNWDGVSGPGRRGVTVLIKAGIVFLVVAACVFLITITNLRRDDEPWSNLQKMWQRKSGPWTVRMSSLSLNWALPFWMIDDRAERRGYFCKVPIISKIYITNNQTHWTMITRLHVEAKDSNGQWRQLQVINTQLALLYGPAPNNLLKRMEPSDGKYLDQQIAGKNIGPGETPTGWLLLYNDPPYDIKGPLRLSISDLQGGPYTVGPIQAGDKTVAIGGFKVLGSTVDPLTLQPENCPVLEGW